MVSLPDCAPGVVPEGGENVTLIVAVPDKAIDPEVGLTWYIELFETIE